MKVKCPVALCEWEGKTYQFHKHIEEYKITWKNVMDSGFPRSESHERWANYFFKEIWNDPNLPEKVKWTNIAIAYVNQSKKQNKMQHKKLSPDGSDNIEMKDGKIMMNGKEYTNEEFQKIMPNIHMPQHEHHEQSVRDITGKLRINGMTPEDYRKKYESQKRVMK